MVGAKEYTRGEIAGGWVHISRGKTPIALVHPKYVDKFLAAPDMRKELESGKEWLSKFVMRFYIAAETPTYERMKALYQEFDEFQRIFGQQALAKVEGK